MNAGSVVYSSLFGGRIIYPDNTPPWIAPAIESKEDIPAVIKRARDAEITELGIVPRWLKWRQRILDEYGVNVTMGYSFHGPATMSAMLCGTTRFLYFLYDYPDFMRDLYRAIEEVGIRFMREMRLITGLPMRGMGVYDDDSALLSPGLFEEFEYPVLERWYREFSPSPGDRRYLHSDGDMTHLLGYLNRLGVNHVNLGPAVDIARIREKMPKTVIHGHIPPFLLRNGEPEEIVERVREDFRKVGHDGGVVVDTAGSINDGTPFENIRALMFAVENFCRFDS
ncbi:MAG: uroporphyrinogen decarboxylase family protein [bacterium]